MLLCCASSIFHRQVWYRMLSLHMHAPCTYSTFGHHPHPLGYSVPNFVSVAPPSANLARREKLDTQSLTHTPSLFDMLGTEVDHFRIYNI